MPAPTDSDPFLRVIAIFKLIKAAAFFCAGIGILHFINKDVQSQFERLLGDLHVDPDTNLAKWCLDQAGRVTNLKLVSFSAISFFYAILFATEGTGLYLRKRWGEWLVVVITGSLLPYEAYLIWHKVTLLKILLTTVNLIILGYLIIVIRRKQEK